MGIKIKPLAAGVAVGAALAAGTLVAMDQASAPAEAQSGSTQAQINDLKTQQTIIQRQNIRAIKQVNTYSQFMRYWLNKGQLVGVDSDAPSQARGVGGELPASLLSQSVKDNFPYWVQVWYDGQTTFWTSRGATDVQRVAAGNYVVTWDKNVEQCASSVSITNIGTFNPPNGHGLAQARWGGEGTKTRYRTWDDNPAGNALTDVDYPITGTIACGDATATNLN